MSARLRQAVLAARDLDAVTAQLTQALGLGEPFRDPDVAYFGLRNAVFAIGDQFLEVVSPTREDAPAARHLQRLGADAAGYMLMFQLDDVAAARERAGAAGVRRVFDVDWEDVIESHLHPGDMGGAIVAVTEPRPATSWRWGGAGWRERAAVGGLHRAVVGGAAVPKWDAILGPGVADHLADATGFVELVLDGTALQEPAEIGGVTFVPATG